MRRNWSPFGALRSTIESGGEAPPLRHLGSAYSIVRQACRLVEAGTVPAAVVIRDFGRSSLKIPRPFRLPFEPMPLKQTDSELRALWNEEQGDSVSPAAGSALTLVRLLEIAGLFMVLAYAILFVLLAWKTRQWPCFLVAGVWVASAYVGWRQLTYEWMVLPGAVMIPSGSGGTTHRNADTVLMLRGSRLGWTAKLWRDGRWFAQRNLTTFEAQALLAAWQARPVLSGRPEVGRDSRN